jgi:hypothetical protein
MTDQPNQDNKEADQTPNDSPEYREYLGLKLVDVSKQIKDEYKVSEKFTRTWRETKRKYLKLYINQRKNPKKVGDTLMFSTHQTILAALYKTASMSNGCGVKKKTSTALKR